MGPLTSTFAARQLGAWAIIALGAVVGRLFGPQARGAIEALIVLRLGLHAVATLGVPSACTFRVAQDPASLVPVASTALGLGLVLGTATGLGLAAWAWLRPETFAPIPPLAASAFFATVPAILVTQMEGGVLLGAARVGAWNSLTVVNRGLLLPALALAYLPPLRHVATVVLGLAFAEVAAAATSLLWLRDGGPVRPRIDRALVRGLARYGTSAWMKETLWFALLRSDVLLLGGMAGNDELGQFAAAGIAREMVHFLPWVAGMLFFPRVARSRGAQAPVERTGRAHPRALGPGGIAIVLGAAVLLFAFAGPFVTGLHGDRFAPATPLVRVLVPAGLLASWGGLCLQELLGRGAPPLAWIAPGTALVVSVAGNLWAIPRHGALGTAWVALLSSAVLLALARYGVARARARDAVSAA